MAPKVVTLHTIYNPYVSKNLKREPAIMAKMNHPIIVSLEGRGRLCWQLLLMPGRRLRPLEATSATWLEVRGLSTSSCRTRWAGGCSTFIIISMTTITMERCQWKWSWGWRRFFSWNAKRKAIVYSGCWSLCSSIRSRLPRPSLPRLQGTRYLSNSVAMMKVITHDDVGNDDANDDVKIMMLTMMMNTNGNDWWWGQQGLVSLFGAQMYFPSLFIIFPKSETANSKYSKYNVTANSSFTKWSKYNMFPSTGANPDRQIWDWCHLCLYQVMMIMVMVVTNMLIMEIQMMTKMTLMRQTRGNVWFLSFCLQSIINHQNTIGSNQQHCLSQDPALRLRLPSSWPGYYDYERMVNDDNFAVYCSCETICVSECFVCMCVYLFILCVGNVKSHMLQDNIFGIHSKLSISWI